MKYLSLFMLALILCAAMALGSVLPGVIADKQGAIERVADLRRDNTVSNSRYSVSGSRNGIVTVKDTANEPIAVVSEEHSRVRMVTKMTSKESNKSNIEVDRIQFETIVPNQVPIVRFDKSDRDNYNYVELGMKITNGTPNPLYFTGYTTLIPELLEPDGQIIEWGRASNCVRGPSASDFLLALPGESVTFFPITVLFWIEGYGASLSIDYGDGSIWGSDTVKAGRYQFRFRYQKIFDPRGENIYRQQEIEQKLLEQVWFGRVDTPFVELHLVKP
jgi:hypothetical protein